jgi:MFS family permease
MAFAALMGITRIVFVKFGERIGLDRFIAGSSILCVVAYLLIVLVPEPAVNLIGCGLCGIGVAILWPGTLSKGASALRNGGTTMFALLAVAGDFGCTAGPTVVGWVSGAMGDNLKAGILTAIIFPLLLIPCILFFRKKQLHCK